MGTKVKLMKLVIMYFKLLSYIPIPTATASFKNHHYHSSVSQQNTFHFYCHKKSRGENILWNIFLFSVESVKTDICFSRQTKANKTKIPGQSFLCRFISPNCCSDCNINLLNATMPWRLERYSFKVKTGGEIKFLCG